MEGQRSVGPSDPFNDNLKLHYELANTSLPVDFLQILAKSRKARAPSVTTHIPPHPHPRNIPSLSTLLNPPEEPQRDEGARHVHHKRSMSRNDFLASLHVEPTMGRHPAPGNTPHPLSQRKSFSVPANLKPTPHSTTGHSWPVNTNHLPPPPNTVRVPSSIQGKPGRDTKCTMKPLNSPPFTSLPTPPSSTSPALSEGSGPSALAQPRPIPLYVDRSDDIVKLEKQLDLAVQRAKTAESALLANQVKVNKLLQQQESATSTMDKLKEENKSLSTTLSSTNKQLDATRDSLSRAQKTQLLRARDPDRDKLVKERDNAERDAQQARGERDRALAWLHQISTERDDLRRAKEKASAERSAAVSKKIELQARLAAFERGGRVIDCPQIDALVRDRDEAKNSREVAVAELAQLREQLQNAISERDALNGDAQTLRARVEQAEQEIRALKQEAERVPLKVTTSKAGEQDAGNDSELQIATPMSPTRKRSHETESPLDPQFKDNSEQLRKRQRITDTVIIN